MAPPQTYMTASSFLGLGIETTRGTPITPTNYLPIDSPVLTPMVGWLEDKGYRGSPAEIYGQVPGPQHATYEAKGNVFLDTFPLLLRAVLGSTDTTTIAPTSTTLSSSAAAGATTISTTATIAAGTFIVVDTGSVLEAHSVTSVSGSGPYTVTLDQPLLYPHNNGAAVTGLTAHQIGLLNSPSTAHQPPSFTIVDDDGVSAKQLAGAIGDSLNLSFGADTAFGWSAKFIGNPFTVTSAPSETYTTEIFVPGYSVNAMIGGTQSQVVAKGEIDMKRSSEAIQTANGTNSPLVNFAGPITVEGKLTLVVISGDNTLTQGTSWTKQAVSILFSEPTTGHALKLQMSQVQYDSPKINRGKNYVQVDTNFKAEANATDAISTGDAPILTKTGNGKTTAY
jgi:hypothetical protein